MFCFIKFRIQKTLSFILTRAPPDIFYKVDYWLLGKVTCFLLYQRSEAIRTHPREAGTL